MARLKDFRGIEGTDFFEQDRGFQLLLTELLPGEERAAIFSSLHECAGLVSGDWNELAREGNRNENLPRLIKTDRVGRRVERVDFGPHARRLRREVAELGVLTGARSELHKFALVYLLGHNGEASLTCGLSCTDGLIRAIEACGSQPLRDTYLPRLRSVATPLAGAQFITEQDGGSDVGAITSEASRNADGSWTITGEKWFCSNPDEYFAVAARPLGSPTGTAGIALFLVPRVLPDGSLNKISFRRLKDKLGTRSLPTAEIDFQEATAYAIGDPADGFKTLMNYIVNASRMHNAANACGFLHRAFLEARNYARQREAFGHEIITYPLIQQSLITLLERLWRHRLLTFRLAALMDENGIAPANPAQAMWQRFLVNLAKYRTVSRLADSVREAILILGGNGIVEDFTILPTLLRDALIIETWEGTDNTLCLQIIRDAARSDLPERWRTEVSGALEVWPQDLLSFTRSRFEIAFRQTEKALSRERITDRQWAEANARRLVDRMGDLLELGWMSQLAARHKQRDSTAALLTSMAGSNLLGSDDPLTHPCFQAISAEAAALIAEQPIATDVARL